MHALGPFSRKRFHIYTCTCIRGAHVNICLALRGGERLAGQFRSI